MKKLFVLSVFVLSGLISTTTFAQEEKVVEGISNEAEVKVSELPDAVTKALKENFVGYTAKKVSKILKQNADTKKNEAFYNVLLTKGKESLIVLIDPKGNVVDKSARSDK